MAEIQTRYNDYVARLESVGQSHLLKYWDELTEDQRIELLDDLDQVDFERCRPLVEPFVKNKPKIELPKEIIAPEILPAAADAERTDLYAKAMRIGTDALKAGKVAAFTVAGGQGTRLGFDGPKGAYLISPIRNISLFQWFAEFLLGAKRRYGTQPRWYIMTSPINHDQTTSFFAENDYFDLGQENVMFFKQGQMPAFHQDGRMVLADKFNLALSPDGHGGSLMAMQRSGALEDMKKHGVEHISYFQVDNPLVRPVDPLFVGMHILTESEMSSRAIPKANDKERVGNFCIADGKMTVIEYSDLPDNLAAARNDDGSRKFDAGSIAIHILTRDFVDRLTSDSCDLNLPWHRADKKVPYIDENGNQVEPTEPNAVKLEMFVFDALPLSQNPMILQTRREEEFSPVKNPTGVDSAETTRRDMIRRASAWLETCGCDIPYNGQGEPDCVIEISPKFALDADDLRQQLKEEPKIVAGGKLLLD